MYEVFSVPEEVADFSRKGFGNHKKIQNNFIWLRLIEVIHKNIKFPHCKIGLFTSK